MPTKFLFPLLLSFGLSPLAMAQDTVRLRNGTTESGRVESEDYDALKFKIKKGKDEQSTSLPWADVVEVTYGAAVEFTQAMGQLNSGNRAAALPRLQALLTSSALRKEMRPAVMYQLGSGQMRSGQYAEAAATLLDLVKTAPKSRYMLPATRALVEIHQIGGDLAAGASAVEAAADAAKEAGIPVNHLMAFDYFRGVLNEAKKDLVKAKLSYQTASRADAAIAGIADMAKVGVARVDAASGQVEEARNAYRGIVEQGRGGNEVLAGAWNGLAKMALDDGVKSKKGDTLVDALFMYLRGVVEFAPAPGEGTGEYERALAGAAETFRQLAETEPDEALKKQRTQSAKQRLDQLRKEFPNSIHLPK